MTIASLVNFVGYKVTETIKNLETNVVLIAVEAEHDQMECVRCGHQLTSLHGRHRIRAKFLPIFNYESYVTVWRRKGSCSVCKKIRSEKIHFLSKDSPHLTSAYESTIEELTEIAPASRVPNFHHHVPVEITLYRRRFHRLRLAPPPSGLIHDARKLGGAFRGNSVLTASSAQSQWHIERVWCTTQDSLTLELRSAGITDMTDANRYMDPVYLPKHLHLRSTVLPKDSNSKYRPLKHRENLDEIFCLKYTRRVYNNQTISFENRIYRTTDRC